MEAGTLDGACICRCRHLEGASKQGWVPGLPGLPGCSAEPGTVVDTYIRALAIVFLRQAQPLSGLHRFRVGQPVPTTASFPGY